MIRTMGRRTILTTSALIVSTLLLAYLAAGWVPKPDDPALPDTLPARLHDADFWRMVTDFSEPSGFFRSDNLLSNERGSQHVIPELRKHIKPGGVYIGVGPEQNFTYIQAFEPKIAFIVDIRRLNMLEHLLYKALFELSINRSQFVSMLFSRPERQSDPDANARELLTAYRPVVADAQYFEQNLEVVVHHLTKTHGFELSPDDKDQLRYIYRAFFQEGPDLSYSFVGQSSQFRLWNMPTYFDLMVATDADGKNWGFLASEPQFHKVREMQKKNLIVPLIGDFAGPKAIRAVARYLQEHNALVSVFYTSNVEMYLFQDPSDWRNFYSNVESLPVNSSSSFVRFVVNRSAFSISRPFLDGPQMWSGIQEVIEGVNGGTIRSYGRLVDTSR